MSSILLYFALLSNGLSRPESVSKHGVPFSTLQDRMNGTVSKSETIQPSARRVAPLSLRLVTDFVINTYADSQQYIMTEGKIDVEAKA